MPRFFIIALLTLSMTACKRELATIEKDFWFSNRLEVMPHDSVGVWHSRTLHKAYGTDFYALCSYQGIPSSRVIQAELQGVTLSQFYDTEDTNNDLSIFDSMELYHYNPDGEAVFLGSLHHPNDTHQFRFQETVVLDDPDLLRNNLQLICRFKTNRRIDSTYLFFCSVSYHLKTN